VGVEYLVLWLKVKTQIVPIDEGCGMDFFPEKNAVYSYMLGTIICWVRVSVVLLLELFH
jgi:hypothetical protein